MKIFFTVSCVMAMLAATAGGEPTRSWSRIWGSEAQDTAFDTATDGAGAVYVAGRALGSFHNQTAPGSRCAFLTRYAADGSLAWTRLWGPSTFSEATAVTVDSTGAVYVAGSTAAGFDGQQAIGSWDAFVCKFTPQGDRLWTVIWGSTAWDEARAITVDPANRIAVTGHTKGAFDGQSGNGNADFFVSTFQADGTRDWTRIWGSTAYDAATGIAADDKGVLTVCGSSLGHVDGQTNQGLYDVCVTRFSPTGDKAWTRMWGGPSDQTPSGIAVDNAGAVYVAGATLEGFNGAAPVGGNDAFLMKIAPTGAALWTRVWGSSGTDFGTDVTVTPAGGVYVSGQAPAGLPFDGQPAANASLFLTHFADDGTPGWSRVWGASAGMATAVTPGAPGRLYTAGFTQGAFDGQSTIGHDDLFVSAWQTGEADPPPAITDGPHVGALAPTSATISWSTTPAADSAVEFGRQSGVYDHRLHHETLEAQHVLTVTGLTPHATYRYRVASATGGGTTYSAPGYFRTPPHLSGPPGLAALDVRTDRVPMILTAATSGEVDRVEFSMDNELLGIDYDPPFMVSLFPALLGKQAFDLLGTHTMQARAFSPTDEEETVTMPITLGRLELAQLDLRIVNPWRSYRIETTTATAPSMALPLQVVAAETEQRPWVNPLDPRVTGQRIASNPVQRVDFYIDGDQVHSSTSGVPGDPFFHETIFDPAGLGLGTHHFSVIAVPMEGAGRFTGMDFDVVHLEPTPVVTRRVTRRGTAFDVSLIVSNAGPVAAELTRIVEPMRGFQVATWTADAPGDVTCLYDTTNRASILSVDLHPALALPAGSWVRLLQYTAVPILYPVRIDHYFGGDGSIRYRDSVTAYDRDVTLRTVSLGDPRAGTFRLMADAVGEARGQATLLIVANPESLLNRHAALEVSDLFQVMAQLADERSGTLGFYNASSPLRTNFSDGCPIAAGNMFSDAGDEFFIGDHGAEEIRAYHVTHEITVATNDMLPHAFDLRPGDAAAMGDVKPTYPSSTNRHAREELMIAWGAGHGADEGRVTTFQYDDATVSRRLRRTIFATAYRDGGVFAAGDIYSPLGEDLPKEELVAGDPVTGQAYAYDLRNGRQLFPLSPSFGPGDVLLIGDVLGERFEQLIVGRRDTGRVQVYSQDHRSATPVADAAIGLAEHDTIAVGDVWGDAREELILADESADRIAIYRYDDRRANLRLLAFFPWEIRPGDRVLCAQAFEGAKAQIVLACAGSRPGGSAGNLLVIMWTGHDAPGDRYGLADLLHADRPWGSVMAPGWSDDGYLLLVGEIEGVPAFDDSWRLWDTRFRVDFTDRDYANTVGHVDRPELAAARIPGDTPARMAAVIRNALAVHRGEARFANTSALAVSGFPEGLSGTADDIDFLIDRAAAQRRLEDHGFSVTLRDTADPAGYTAAQFMADARHRDVIFLAAHGNWNVCDIVHAPGVYDSFDPLSTRPLVVASSCLTGRYPRGASLAEAFLEKGAAAYIGGTVVLTSPICMYLVNSFLDRLAPGASVGVALREAKLDYANMDRGDAQRANNYNCAALQLFGDPTLTLAGAAGAGLALMRAEDRRVLQEPMSPLDLVVPDFIVRHGDAEDRVSIPGHGMTLHQGRPAVPCYSVTLEAPAGTQVQEVRWLQKGGLTSTNGLRLPTVDLRLPLQGGRSRAASTPEPGVWPTNDFTWSVDQLSGGRTRLDLTVYPFRHDPQTLASTFHKTWQFAIDTTTSTVSINRLATGRDSYAPGVPVDLLLYAWNSATQSVDVIVETVIRDSGGDVAGGAPYRTLRAARGLASLTLEWDAAGAAPGAYTVETVLRSADGLVLDRAFHAFDLLPAAGALTDLAMMPAGFRMGDDVTLSASLSNDGVAELTGILVMQVRDARGRIVTEFRHELADLAPAASVAVTSVWSQASLVPRDCQLVAYLLNGDGAATALATDWTTAPLLCDAVFYSPAGGEIAWPSVTGRSYAVFFSTNLLTMDFDLLTNPLHATPPMNCFTDRVDRPACFYRVTESW